MLQTLVLDSFSFCSCVSICHLCGDIWEIQKRASDLPPPPPELELRASVSFPGWTLVTELKTSEKAASVPKYGAISIVLWLTHLKKNNSSKLLYGMTDFQ